MGQTETQHTNAHLRASQPVGLFVFAGDRGDGEGDALGFALDEMLGEGKVLLEKDLFLCMDKCRKCECVPLS